MKGSGEGCIFKRKRIITNLRHQSYGLSSYKCMTNFVHLCCLFQLTGGFLFNAYFKSTISSSNCRTFKPQLIKKQIIATIKVMESFPSGADGKEPTCQCRRHKRHGFDPCARKIPWRRAWQPTPVFMPRGSLDRGA